MPSRRFLFPIVIVIAIMLSVGIYGAFFAGVTAEVESEAFKSLVDADAALLGFLGIISVFILNTYRDAARITEDKIQKLKVEHEREAKLATSPSIAQPVMKSNHNAVERSYAEFKAKLQELENHLNDQREGSKESLSFTILGGISFVVSIMLCLVAMSNVSTQVRFSVAYFAVGATSIGLFCMFAMIWNLRVRLG